ncbi:MAG: peptidyl-tRNA hydrolase [Candidatus Methanomethylicota archaeon]|mgnify:CR=1 FL=1|uniref:Peptidyl-tRNA hydrolase n=1 Tax=Thermoproteota archaeon TaxID=2056631 RepID=A0A497ERL1_9CREN|nr:MAG: peptidyl-tRNA hydrolase [Candidatus Verstraetearchaeota archaeon]
MSELKQVIVVRADLKMSRGKLAVQVAHAAVCAAEEARNKFNNWWKDWLTSGQKKVVVKVKDEEELLRIFNLARLMNLPSVLISNRGLTELPPGTITCVGIGPAPSELIDKITGTLPLL